MNLKENSGQALLEYMIILAFIGVIGGSTVQFMYNFLNGSIGNLNHILSRNLNIGTCSQDCFFGGYKNGYKE